MKNWRFSSKIRNKANIPTLDNFIQCSTRVQARGISQEKEIKDIHTRKKEIKLSIFEGDMFLNVENPKDSSVS